MVLSFLSSHRMRSLEAAAEIAAQLRLRNLSGIIIIDFIDMERITDPFDAKGVDEDDGSKKK